VRRTEFFAFRETNVEKLAETINQRMTELADRKPTIVSVHYETAPYRTGTDDYVYHNALVVLDLLEDGTKKQARIM
jgi:hypothetical protein